MKKNRVLIIEDDQDLREGLKEIEKNMYDIVLLDCNLPDGTGFELCKEVRGFSNIPIIMLTARDTEMDEIKALEMGVNDYLSKPFSLGVLKARMKRILQEKKKVEKVISGSIAIDQNTCKVSVMYRKQYCKTIRQPLRHRKIICHSSRFSFPVLRLFC